MALNDYLNLITSEHRSQPKFIEMVSRVLEVLSYEQDLLLGTVADFDVDTAVGVQLDAVGVRVGISRIINMVPTGVYFTWGGTDETGWGNSMWFNNTAQPTVLIDDVYRNLIRAKIAANNWDGTIEGAYAVWRSAFPDSGIIIQDNQDMSFNLGIVGENIDSVTIALLTKGYLELKPAGVRINIYYVSQGQDAFFGWGTESNVIKGWGEGSWTKAIS